MIPQKCSPKLFVWAVPGSLFLCDLNESLSCHIKQALEILFGKRGQPSVAHPFYTKSRARLSWSAPTLRRISRCCVRRFTRWTRVWSRRYKADEEYQKRLHEQCHADVLISAADHIVHRILRFVPAHCCPAYGYIKIQVFRFLMSISSSNGKAETTVSAAGTQTTMLWWGNKKHQCNVTKPEYWFSKTLA